MRAPILALAAATLLATSSAAAPRLETSWGKADVSLDQYRADAVACATEAWYRDVSDTEAARILVDASRKLDTISETGLPNSGNTESGIYPSAGAATESSFNTSYNPKIERSLEMAQRFARTVAAARPEKQMADIARLQRTTVAQCLVARGYREFRLTEAQHRHLRKLKRGSDERRAYLFSLARDPQVLAAQAV